MNESKMTIAIDIRLVGKNRTGDETVFFHLTKELLKLDKINRYLLLTDETRIAKVAALYAKLECIGQTNAEIVSLSAGNRFVWNLFVLPRYLFQNRIDIFHTQYILPFFSPRRTKIITHIHDVSFRAHPTFIRWSDRLFLSLLIPSSLRKAALIIAPSQFTKNEIIRYYGIPEEKIAVIPNSTGELFLENVAGNQEKTDALREKYGLPEQFVLSVGTLQPRKNIPFLIHAFALLQKRLPEMKLVIVGNRQAYHTDPEIETAVATRGLRQAVIFPGFVDQDDLPAVIRLARIFAFPSLYEGFGIPLLEAMSQSVPVAASALPSLQEIGGDAALYFDPTSIANCEEKLYTLCTHPLQRETLQRAGKERIKLFSWRRSALLLLDAYRKITRTQTEETQ
ncbi:MAG: glycosyltransferase family 1 protein [Candidatus Moraniibacteriota bacterium]